MTYTQFIKLLEAAKPTGFTVWAGRTKDHYNAEPTPSDVVLIELPDWPSGWREYCPKKVNIKCWVGKLVSLLPEGTTQMHAPYSGTELIDTLATASNAFASNLTNGTYIHVMRVSDYKYFDAVEGISVNAQAWMTFDIEMLVWPMPAPTPPPPPAP
jgi:hypothetical protein